MSTTWKILKADKRLLAIPFISGACCLILLATFVVPLHKTGSLTSSPDGFIFSQSFSFYAVLFAFYLCNYFVILFFNSIIVACAANLIRGNDPSISNGFRMAVAHLPSIFGWALISATVMLMLRIIEGTSRSGRRFIASILGTLWSVITYLVVPIMVIEGKGPGEAMDESKKLVEKTWGKMVMGDFSFGWIFFLFMVPALPVIMMIGDPGNGPNFKFLLGGAVIYLIAIATIQSALQALFHMVMYFYACDGKVPFNFPRYLVENSVIPHNR